MTMSKDIAPALLEKIEKYFKQKMDSDSEIKTLTAKIKSGKASYKDAQSYAIRVSEIMSEAFNVNLASDVLPDGKLYYNIASRIFNRTLGKDGTYGHISKYAKLVQEAINKNAGIGIRAIVPKINQDRIDGIIDIVSGKDKFDDIKYMTGEHIINYGQAIVDDTVRVNAAFHGEAGLKAKVVRTTAKPCKWCERRRGEYTYPDVPKEVYQRHKYCKCLVTYESGGKRPENIHTKKFVTPEELKRRKSIGLEKSLKKDPNSILKKLKEPPANTAKPLEDTGKSDTIELRILRTIDDPMREVTGAGLISHPNEIKVIIEDLENSGVEIEYRPNAMGYMPSPTRGKAGKLVIDEEASYSAWKHEYIHFTDDREDGYIGLRAFADSEKCKQREMHAYDVEIELAKEARRPDIVERLKALKIEEMAKYEQNADID